MAMWTGTGEQNISNIPCGGCQGRQWAGTQLMPQMTDRSIAVVDEPLHQRVILAPHTGARNNCV